ncbi:hypothetical protein HDF19_07775 [Mucilaginibacter sp. E4BP6]|jgi:hypothetical protein|uniref:hypothetical protein n=1 Tax=Mucilaginibacter sp. E4BP6 TaxID=2723089 RepID=UPI0015C929FE|nr:hypothetical protein [Mucilaginibacter sp. E4BP6]NYE67506.1 hypothetical protein [Mucilaginibacter sp. E4BP6]
MKFYFVLNAFIIASFIGLNSYAQQNQSPGIPITKLSPTGAKPGSKDTTVMVRGTKQQDIGDVLHKLFHSKTTPEIDSITSKPQVSVIPAVGYSLVTSFAVVVSGNIAFRNGPQSRISTVVASASYTENKQIIIPIQTSFWTKDNSYEFVGNYSYLKYPQSTYGLGSDSKIAANDPMDYSLIQFYETILRHVGGNFYAGLGYDFDDHWDISEKGNPDGSVSDYAKYGTATRTISSGFTLNGQLDSRDNAINPSKGAYIGLQLRNSDKNFGATKNWQSLIIDVRKYINFPEGSDNTLALWNYDWMIIGGKPPYLDLPATGWDANFATGRGYIQGRFRGNEMIYTEAEYRYKITADGVLGGTVFVNGESFTAERGTSLQSIQPGFGPGLRVKLNKVSNTNISINYGFGNEGSRGLFISVGEAF